MHFLHVKSLVCVHMHVPRKTVIMSKTLFSSSLLSGGVGNGRGAGGYVMAVAVEVEMISTNFSCSLTQSF